MIGNHDIYNLDHSSDKTQGYTSRNFTLGGFYVPLDLE